MNIAFEESLNEVRVSIKGPKKIWRGLSLCLVYRVWIALF